MKNQHYCFSIDEEYVLYKVNGSIITPQCNTEDPPIMCACRTWTLCELGYFVNFVLATCSTHILAK